MTLKPRRSWLAIFLLGGLQGVLICCVAMSSFGAQHQIAAGIGAGLGALSISAMGAAYRSKVARAYRAELEARVARGPRRKR